MGTLSSGQNMVIECPYYKASIAPNQKILNDLKPSKEQLEKVYGGMMTAVNELWFQIASKTTLSSIDHQGKSLNTNIANVQGQNGVFWPLDDIELVDWMPTNKFARLWFCEDIHHLYILELAIKKAIQKSTNRIFLSQLFEDDSKEEKTSVCWVCVFTQKGHIVDIIPHSQLCSLPY
jgi:hypothetical protein